MSRARARFREADVQRAVNGARKAGLSIASVRIAPDGTIDIIPGAPGSVPVSPADAWDEALKRKPEPAHGR